MSLRLKHVLCELWSCGPFCRCELAPFRFGQTCRAARRADARQSMSACDGSHVLFVGGQHHSGTGIVAHALKVRGLGRHTAGIDREIRDAWPPLTDELACTDKWVVYKRPTNAPVDTHRMLHLRLKYPNMTQVYVTRDLANVAWSLVKRFKVWRSKNIADIRDKYCASNIAWLRHERHRFDFDLGLQEFTRTPRAFVERFIPVPTLTERVGDALTAGASNVSARSVHYGVHKPTGVIELTDEELGVAPYEPLIYHRESISAVWQQKFNDPKLYGSHGVTDLLNISATLHVLACDGKPPANVSAWSL